MHFVRVLVDLSNSAVLAKAGLLLGNSIGHCNPDPSSSSVSRESEHGVGTPIASGLVENDILSDILQIGGSDTLAKPLALHLRSSNKYGKNWATCYNTFVVGTAQTLKLYGLMNTSAMPTPIVRRIHSSNVWGLLVAVRASNAASIIPSIHLTLSSVGSIEMLFWNGNGTQRPLYRT